MKKIRYAVVGAGWIAQEAFLPAVAGTGNSVVTALISGDPEKAKVLGETYGIEHTFTYEQYGTFLHSGVADAVYLALPNDMHLEFAVPTLKSGLHLLLEKPMALDEDQCQAIIAAADRGNAKLMIAYRLHTEPATVAAIALAKGGKLGTLRYFSAAFSQAVSLANHRADPSHWAGPLPDMGIYPLNAARHLFGAEPVEVTALRSGGAIEHETVAVTMRFAGGGIAQFTCSYGAAPVNTLRLVGTLGELTLTPAFGYGKAIVQTVTVGGKTEEQSFAPTSQFGGELQYFSACILKDERPQSDGREGLADVRVIKAIERSLNDGRTVELAAAEQPATPRAKDVRTLTPVKKGELVHAAPPGEG